MVAKLEVDESRTLRSLDDLRSPSMQAVNVSPHEQHL